MQKAFINPQKCLRCEKCSAAETCPSKAIFRIDTEEPAIIEQESCYGCGDCIEKCPAQAIAIKEI